MARDVHYSVIGVFVVVGFVLLAGFVFFFARIKTNTERYDVVFAQNVTGVVVGSPVSFNGVRVGEVTEISLDANDAARVAVGISVRRDLPIKSDTTARLQFLGITGLSGILLTGGSTNLPNLRDVTPPQQTPVIVAHISDLHALFDESSSIMQSINAFLSPETVEDVVSLLRNLESFSTTLAGDDVKQTIMRLNRLSAKLEEDVPMLLERHIELAGDLQSVLRDDVPILAEDMTKLLEQADVILKTINDSVQIGEAMLGEVNQTLQEVELLVRHSDELVIQLQNQPNSLIFGRNRPIYGD